MTNKNINTIDAPRQTKSCVSYVADEEHYTEVFRRMTEVKHSLKIATGDLKNFNVTIEADDGEETLRLCDFFYHLLSVAFTFRWFA